MEDKILCNVTLTFKISVMLGLSRLEKGSRIVLKYLERHSLILTKSSYSNFWTAITNAGMIRTIKTSTLWILNTDLKLQFEMTKPLLSSHRYQLILLFTKAFLHSRKRRKHCVLLDVKTLICKLRYLSKNHFDLAKVSL